MAQLLRLAPIGSRRRVQPHLWFVTPAHGRHRLSRVCAIQRARTVYDLRRAGLPCDVVVVACDENLQIARDVGFHTVERDNEWLGRRFNDGIRYAVDHGASHVTMIGSDTFASPEPFLNVLSLRPNDALVSHYLSVVSPDGSEMAQIFHRRYVQHVYPAWAITGRPCRDELRRGCDSSIRAGIMRDQPRIRLQHVAEGPLERVSFQSGVSQVTPYRPLSGYPGARKVEGEAIWETIGSVYARELVSAARSYYESGAALAA